MPTMIETTTPSKKKWECKIPGVVDSDQYLSAPNRNKSCEKVKGLGTSNAIYGISDSKRSFLFNSGAGNPNSKQKKINDVAYKKTIFRKDNGKDGQKRAVVEYVKQGSLWLLHRVFYTSNHYQVFTLYTSYTNTTVI